jgi:tetratricopeptide (TPR) repeat protein
MLRRFVARSVAMIPRSCGGGVLAVGVCALILQFNVRLVSAQQAAYARETTETADELAKRALDCLHRGEDATTSESKLASYKEGLDFATRAVAADDHNADAHFVCFATRGRIMLLEGAGANPVNLLSLNRELDRALELDPNHTDALAAKGGLYRQLPWVLGGSLEKAERYLSRSVELDPDAVGARIELAETYRDMGHPERSVPLLEKAAQVAERMGKYRQLGEARSLLHDLQSAR